MFKTHQTRTENYALLDFGNGRKLERFGSIILDRVSPAADGLSRIGRDWSKANVRLDEQGKCLAGKPITDPWCARVSGMCFQLRMTPFGHVGLFPEQESNWNWLQSLHEPDGTQAAPKALNLFAYTGGSTMALARGGYEVVHVDASAPAVRWARENAALNELTDHPVRWIVEDARKFVHREYKREKRYDVIVLDPPSFGHGPSGDRWDIEVDLFPLLSGCLKLLNAGGQMLFTAHCENPSSEAIAEWLNQQCDECCQLDSQRLGLTDLQQRTLDCGFSIRLTI